MDDAVEAAADGEGRVERPVSVEASNAVARRSVVGRELTADDHLAVWLDRDSVYGVVRAGVGQRSCWLRDEVWIKPAG